MLKMCSWLLALSILVLIVNYSFWGLAIVLAKLLGLV